MAGFGLLIRFRRLTRFRRLVVLVALGVGLLSGSGMALGQLSTADHLTEPGFWPTQDQPSRAEFVGTAACSRCHASMTASQVETPMARNMAPAATAQILQTHRALNFAVDQFKYRIDTDANRAMYSVSNGTEKLAYPLQWAFGTGRVAQSYLFRKEDGGFYEARASFFVKLNALDFTPGRTLLKPSSTDEAMDRHVGMSEVQRCFACHATAANISGKFDEEHMMPGVTCEACHGPGADHVKATGRPAAGEAVGAAGGPVKPAGFRPTIFNPADLTPADAVDFCGACHSSWWDVKLSDGKGVSTTRSAPYRLVTSKCWGKGDARLTCTACHDPHKQLETRAAAYDGVCRTCHVSGAGAKPTGSHPGAACPTGATSECTSCHMKKTYVPEMHADFTDHRIRIVRPGEAFPE
jgi:hypothetical protein